MIEESKIATVEQRNRMFVGDEVEVFEPNKDYFIQRIDKMWDEEGNEIEVAPSSTADPVKIHMENQ